MIRWFLILFVVLAFCVPTVEAGPVRRVARVAAKSVKVVKVFRAPLRLVRKALPPYRGR